MLGFKLIAVDGLTLGVDEEIKLGSLDCSIDCSNDGKLEGLILRVLLGFSDGPQQ